MALNLDALKNKRLRRQFSGWAPKEGDNLIRILPMSSSYFSDDLIDFAIEFHSHFLKAEGHNTEVVRCLRDRKEACPICVEVARYRSSQNNTLSRAADEVRASERHAMNVLALADISAGIQAYECGPQVYDQLLGFFSNPAWGDLADPVHGRNVVLTLTPASKSRTGYNSYSAQPNPDKVDITPHLPENWHERIDALQTTIPEYPSAEQTERWLVVLGFKEPTTPKLAAVAPVQPPPAESVAPVPPQEQQQPSATTVVQTTTAPAALTTLTAPVLPASPQTTTYAAAPSPALAEFCSREQVLVKQAAGKGLVPQCFSEGPGTGYNPANHPCDHGCPVRADCQLRTLGLA